VFFVMLAAMDGAVAAATPTTSTPDVNTLNAGACFGSIPNPAASIRVTWTITNPDAALYSAKLYENNILKSTQDTAASMNYDKTVAGFVEGGNGNWWNADWTYRVDVVRKSDSEVVSTGTSAEWTQQYGEC